MGRKSCCVKRCGTNKKTKSNISFHSFPSAKHILNIWLDIINKENKGSRPQDKFVCSRHFTPGDYITATRLSPVATPTIFLENYADFETKMSNQNNLTAETPSSNNILSTIVKKQTDQIQSESCIEQPIFYEHVNGKTGNLEGNIWQFVTPGKCDLKNIDDQFLEETETILIKEEIIEDPNDNCVFEISRLTSTPPLAHSSSSLNEIKCGEIFYIKNKFKFKCFLCGTIEEDSKILEQHFISTHFIELCQEISDRPKDENSFKELELKQDEITLLSDNPEIDDENNGLSESVMDEKSTSQNKLITMHAKKSKSQTKCNFCELKLENTRKLWHHLSLFRNKQHICNICNQTYCGIRRFNEHIKVNHNTPIKKPLLFSCDICSANLKTFRNIKVHMRLHTNDRPYVCRECGKRFNNNSALKFHFRHNHTTERPFQCSECGKCFPFLRNLNAHVRQIHFKSEFSEDAKCTLCAKQFRFKYELTRHMIVHKNNRPFSCNVCEKTFKLRTVLKNHLRLHSDDKSYECQFCDKRFAQLAGRHWHMRQEHGKS